MKEKVFSQEGLKIIACVTMLIDHIGAVLVNPGFASSASEYLMLAWANVIMRCIGRTAFPIFCFLLVEGAYHTGNPRKYALRMGIAMLISEIPFDLAFFGRLDWGHQNVMVTLLLGFGMVYAMKQTEGIWKLAWILPAYFAAELLKTDYAGEGILLIAMFALVKGSPYEKWLRLAGMVLLFWDNLGMYSWNLSVPIYYNRFKLLSAIPIFCYSGRKLTYSKVAQCAFYLFYPVHMAILVLIT